MGGWAGEWVSYSAIPEKITTMYFMNRGKCHHRSEGYQGLLGNCSMLRIWEKLLDPLSSLSSILAAARASVITNSPTREKHLPLSTQPPPPTKTEPVSLALAPSHLPNSRKPCQVSEKHKVCDSKNRPVCDPVVHEGYVLHPSWTTYTCP